MSINEYGRHDDKLWLIMERMHHLGTNLNRQGIIVGNLLPNVDQPSTNMNTRRFVSSMCAVPVN